MFAYTTTAHVGERFLKKEMIETHTVIGLPVGYEGMKITYVIGVKV